MDFDWATTEWLPAELEVIEWPLLTRTRTEHLPLAQAYLDARREASDVRARFAAEDREAAHGVNPGGVATGRVTPPQARHVAVRAAEQRVGDALIALCAFVEHAVPELLGAWHEVDEALEVQRDASQRRQLRRRLDHEPAPEAPDDTDKAVARDTRRLNALRSVLDGAGGNQVVSAQMAEEMVRTALAEPADTRSLTAA